MMPSRSEQQMLDLILGVARADERVRAVILDGSRADANAPRDPLQDYDIIYAVTDVEAFRNNLAWIERFGELLILQLPNEMQSPPPDERKFPVYLMQFQDGNRIDLTILPLSLAGLERDSIRSVLLDKDGRIDLRAISDEHAYLPHPPSAKQFADCCNEFWWVSPYVAKGLWRNQIVYAHQMLDEYVRAQLNLMLKWYIAEKTGGKANPGKLGKYYQRYLEAPMWQLLQLTYADAAEEHIWQALFAAGDVFRQAAQHVAAQHGYTYPGDDDQRVTAFLQHLRTLDRNAASIH
jgi:aminoglycoside 6-adenylyltransferase